MSDIPRVSIHQIPGLTMPIVGLGTDKLFLTQLDNAVDAALSAGYRMFDTAKVYGNEADLGLSLEKSLVKHNLKREDIWLTTKVLKTDNSVREDVQDSLQKLRTSYLDLVLIHYPRSNANLDQDTINAQHRKELYLGLEKLQEEGLIRTIGVSNYEICHIEEIKRFGKKLPAVNQIELHPHFVRSELREYCDKEGIVVQAFTSLARHNEELLAADAVTTLARKYSVPNTTILLSWAVSQGIAIIPKSASPQRIQDNLKCLAVFLSPEEVASLSALDREQNYVGRCTGWKITPNEKCLPRYDHSTYDIAREFCVFK